MRVLGIFVQRLGNGYCDFQFFQFWVIGLFFDLFIIVFKGSGGEIEVEK